MAKASSKKVQAPVEVQEVLVPSDEDALAAIRYELEELNHSELVMIAKVLGLRADRSLNPQELVDMILAGAQVHPCVSRVQTYCDELMRFVKGNRYFLIQPGACVQDCRLHPDLIVLQCHRTKDRVFRHWSSVDEFIDLVESAVESPGAR